MLRFDWKNVYDEEDLKKWNKVVQTSPPLSHSFQFRTINSLMQKYFRNNSGSPYNADRFSVGQKFEMLKKTMEELEFAIAENNKNESDQWHQRRDEEEDLGAKLTREEDLRDFASFQTRRLLFVNAISKKKGFDINIEKKTVSNNNYREVLFTTSTLQLVVMSLIPKEEIGMETHKDGSQFIRVEKGTGKAIISGREIRLKENSAIVIPSGSRHNIINTGKEDLKLYTVYTPPQHEDGLVAKTKEEAMKKEGSIKISSRDAVKDTIDYWDKAGNKDFSKYWRLLRKKKKKTKASVPNPIRQNYDYDGSNWIDRVKNSQTMKKRQKS